MKNSSFSFIIIALLVALLGGCASDPRLSTDIVYMGGRRVPSRPFEDKRMNFDNISYWDGDAASGAPSIKISRGEQKAFFYKGGELVGISAISTGREEFGTPPGSFRIQQKNKDHASSKYGDYVDSEGNVLMKDIDRTKDKMPPGAKYDGAKMPHFMRINGGVGMHEGFLPGYPASHGCIRMPGFMAEAFFNNVTVGTPVVIE